MPPPSALRRMVHKGNIYIYIYIYIYILYRYTGETTEWRPKRLTHIDIWPSNKVLAPDTILSWLSFVPNNFQILSCIYKIMGRTRKGFNRAYAERLIANCALDLWSCDIVFALVALDTILVWYSFVPNNFQIPPCKTKLWARHKKVSSGPIYKS